MTALGTAVAAQPAAAAAGALVVSGGVIESEGAGQSRAGGAVRAGCTHRAALSVSDRGGQGQQTEGSDAEEARAMARVNGSSKHEHDAFRLSVQARKEGEGRERPERYQE